MGCCRVLLYASYSFRRSDSSIRRRQRRLYSRLFIVFTPPLRRYSCATAGVKSIVAVLVSVIGLAILSLQPGLGMRVGDALVLACAFLYSVHIILLDGYVKKYDLILLTFVQMLILP